MFSTKLARILGGNNWRPQIAAPKGQPDRKKSTKNRSIDLHSIKLYTPNTAKLLLSKKVGKKWSILSKVRKKSRYYFCEKIETANINESANTNANANTN